LLLKLTLVNILPDAIIAGNQELHKLTQLLFMLLALQVIHGLYGLQKISEAENGHLRETMENI
jgi:hypothetical protein